MSATGTTTWVTIALADLASYLESGLLTPLNTKDLASGQTDRFTKAMTDVVAEVRATIQSSKQGFAVSATANSVPPELKRATCCQIILAMQAACPALVVEKDKRKILEDAVSAIEDVRKGDLRPSNPPDPQVSDVQGFPSAEVVRGREYSVTDCSMRGL